MKKLLLILFIVSGLSIQLSAQEVNDEKLVSSVDSSLVTLKKIQNKIIDVHPFIKNLHPVAIVANSSLYMFEYDSSKAKYNFVKKTKQPFNLNENIQASFPLSTYDNKPSCIVGKKIFTKPGGYSIIFHEFIHCTQANTVELKIKETLSVYNEAMKNKDYMWELNFPFPYEEEEFVKPYSNLMKALITNNDEDIKKYRAVIRSVLTKKEYEYLVWQEWKEGFARYVENKINISIGSDKNDYGNSQPYNRISFYFGGSEFIDYIVEKNPRANTDLEFLYSMLKNY